MSQYRRHRWSGRHTAHISRPTRRPGFVVPACGFCSMRMLTFCEFPGCNTPLCTRHLHRKGGGNLCRNHRHAKLMQMQGVPAVGAGVVEGTISKFKPRGPAMPWGYR